MSFNIYDFIEKTKNKSGLTQEEIKKFVNLSFEGKIPNYQISAWLMAVCIQGLNDQETYFLTSAMRDSGKIYDFPRIDDRLKVDKHSTGGVGDTVTIILMPLLVAAGLTSAKMSGKGLGFTGGTIDKLSAIGINTSLSFEESLDVYKKCGMVILQQTNDIAPADGVFYALRDVTATVQSIPLIASSVMSKKLAIKNDYLFLDVKYGDGALCTTLEYAKQLSDCMLKIANQASLKTFIHITSMQQPLSSAIGNSIEVVEAIRFLKGKPCNPRIYELITRMGGMILCESKMAKNEEEGRQKMEELIKNQKGWEVMKNWLMAENVDIKYVEDEKYFAPKYKVEVFAQSSGYIAFKSVQCFGHVSILLGGGRVQETDEIDPHAGIMMNCQINDEVKKNDLLYTIYSSKEIPQQAVDTLTKNTLITQNKVELDPLIINFN